jgi:hypothetical protein
MSRSQIYTFAAVLVETLAEGSGRAPRGHAYMGLAHAGVTFNDFNVIERLLVALKAVTLEGDELVITADGRKLAAEVAEARRADEAAR